MIVLAKQIKKIFSFFRLLKTSGLPLKRSVKLILWGGHEQIFAGSRAYVADSLGDMWTGELKPEAERISAYFNLDNGAGKIKGLYCMGNDQAMDMFQDLLADFEGQNHLTLQYTDQTDHELFDRLNIPAFQFIQEPRDYINALHHTNMDLPEYVDEQDLKESALMLAALVWQLANQPEKVPRKAFNSPAPFREGSTTFRIQGYPDAKHVQLIGTFNNWNLFGTSFYQTEDGWECKLQLPPGEYLYKFYIDGEFIADPQTDPADLRKDGKGHGGLTKLVVP